MLDVFINHLNIQYWSWPEKNKIKMKSFMKIFYIKKWRSTSLIFAAFVHANSSCQILCYKSASVFLLDRMWLWAQGLWALPPRLCNEHYISDPTGTKKERQPQLAEVKLEKKSKAKHFLSLCFDCKQKSSKKQKMVPTQTKWFGVCFLLRGLRVFWALFQRGLA